MNSTNCVCPECCEFRAARDEDLACAAMYDYATALHQRARKDWEHSTTRFRTAISAMNRQHGAVGA